MNSFHNLIDRETSSSCISYSLVIKHGNGKSSIHYDTSLCWWVSNFNAGEIQLTYVYLLVIQAGNCPKSIQRGGSNSYWTPPLRRDIHVTFECEHLSDQMGHWGHVGYGQNYQMGWQDTKIWEKWEVNYDDYHRPSSLAKLVYNYVGYNSSVWYYITYNYI